MNLQIRRDCVFCNTGMTVRLCNELVRLELHATPMKGEGPGVHMGVRFYFQERHLTISDQIIVIHFVGHAGLKHIECPHK